MRTNRSRSGGSAGRSSRRPPRRTGRPPEGSRTQPGRGSNSGPRPAFHVPDRREALTSEDTEDDRGLPGDPPFRLLLAVHRPRYRGRAARAAALVGWEVTTLLNKQDVVGHVAKGPRPPDIVMLSGDFGRQRDYAIFRAIQGWRKQGMHLIGMVDDCESAPPEFPESAPENLCDVCVTPPYKMVDLRSLFVRLYEQIRGVPAPPPRTAAGPERDDDVEGL